MRKWVLVLLILVAVMWACVEAAVVTNAFLVVPTVGLRVLNDTPDDYTITGCLNDPALLHPGDTVTDAYAIPHNVKASCFVYGRGSTYVGCLFIPTTTYKEGDTVRLSRFRHDVPITQCGLVL